MKKNEKNSALEKEPEGSFVSDGKEPFKSRLRSLFKGRSLYQVSKDWDINLSTLKNYFARQSSIPRHEVLSKISHCEGVSVDWLLSGEDEAYNETKIKTKKDQALSSEALKLAEMLDLLSAEDLSSVSKMLVLKGVETILYLTDENNIELLRLDNVVKEKILWKFTVADPEEAKILDQEARERVGSGTAGHERTPNLKQDKKQAV